VASRLTTSVRIAMQRPARQEIEKTLQSRIWDAYLESLDQNSATSRADLDGDPLADVAGRYRSGLEFGTTASRCSIAATEAQDSIMSEVIVQLRENGPILIKGPITLVDHLGNVFDLTSAKANVALCRCSHSGRRPFCDGSHKAHGFCATETAAPAPP